MGGPLYEIYLLRWLSCSFSLFWICDEKETQPKCAHAALICNSKSYQNTKKEAAMKFYLVRYLATSKKKTGIPMSGVMESVVSPVVTSFLASTCIVPS